MLKKFYPRLLLLILSALAFALTAAAQEDAPEPPAAPPAQEQDLKQEIDEKFLNLERRLYGQNELGLRRLEHVEERIDASQRYIDRVLLIFALSILVIFLFIATHLKNQQRIASERVKHATQNAENLMKDIQRELARPEMEHLRISQILRRLMRQLRDQSRQIPSQTYIHEIRNAGKDPFLPTSLHFIARILAAEHDGNWNTAVQMLEQLREMDSQDPDVLLHLSHVHKNIAARAGDGKVRKRHQRLSYQYFGQFTSTMQAEGTPLEGIVPPQTTADSLPKDQAATAAAPSQQETQQEALATPPPTATDRVAAAEAKPASQSEIPPAAAAPAAETTPPPADKAPPAEQQVKATPPAAAISADTPSAADAAPPIAKTPTADKPPAVTETPKTDSPPPPAQDKSATAADKSDAPAATAKQRLKNALSQAKQVKSGSIKKSLSSFQQLASKTSAQNIRSALGGLASVTKILSDKGDEPLPFLPVPPTSDIPTEGDEHVLEMWREIQRGDLTMARATQAKTVRERNRMIDSALICYARAQGHKTNKTLYYNWGITLLAKALHMPIKKRAPFYNAAVDKFLAGNVIAPNYFDFHLASLYAIIGNQQECRKWLTIARDNNGLDAHALMQASDFDSVRNEAWFDEFLQ